MRWYSTDSVSTTGASRFEGDAGVGEVVHQAERERVERRLARGVRQLRDVRRRELAGASGRRRDVDDAALVALEHAGEEPLDQRDRGEEVEVQRGLPPRDGDLEERADERRRRVVHEHIGGAVRVPDLVDDPLGVLGAREVGVDRAAPRSLRRAARRRRLRGCRAIPSGSARRRCCGPRSPACRRVGRTRRRSRGPTPRVAPVTRTTRAVIGNSSAHHDAAAVGHQRLAGDERAGVGQEEADDRRDVLLEATVARDRLAGEAALELRQQLGIVEARACGGAPTPGTRS